VNPALPSIDELTNDSLYLSLKAYVIQTTGLNYYSDKDDDLVRRICRRLSSLGLHDCASYLEVLRDPVRGRSELDELIAEITIGETYFFRHQEHFDALRDIVLPELLIRNQHKRSLRIWCAGCADGPEVYSLAILLQREMSHKLADWDVSILGTDINQRSLARAREGRFEEWALRATSDDLRQECFIKEGISWRIAPKYRRWTSFRYHNLVEDPAPSPVNNITAFDLIVCRNVTIYFGPEMTRQMIQRFHECLVEDAWLLVGPTEPNMTFFTSFCAVNAPGVTLYQKKVVACTPAAAPIAIKPTAAPPLRMQSAKASGFLPQKTASLRSVESVEHTLAEARFHADRGEWANAVECCEALLRKDSLNSQVHFYYALILEQMGRRAEVEPALRKAIYLDRQSALPHYYLGLFLQSRGDPRQAARSFENAIELLELLPEADILADADGITVAEMKKLVKMHLEVLDT
jgi:chemotaxis protein methyltransferase CheR